ncbi:MAG: hypothetical protein WCQ77_10730 [Planctomycetota bacterium]
MAQNDPRIRWTLFEERFGDRARASDAAWASRLTPGERLAVVDGLFASVRTVREQAGDWVAVDLVIQADVAAALRLARTLTETPFEPLFDGIEDVVTSAFILPLRHRTTGVRLDVAIGMTGFEQDAIARATIVDVGGMRMPVATVEDLLVMKALAGRPQDDQDIRGLVAAAGAGIDWDRCLAVADTLGSAIDLDIAVRLRTARRGV